MTDIKTTMYLETTIHDRLADEAARRGVTMSALATEAVRRHLDRTAPIGALPRWKGRLPQDYLDGLDAADDDTTLAHSLVDSVADYRIRGEGEE